MGYTLKYNVYREQLLCYNYSARLNSLIVYQDSLILTSILFILCFICFYSGINLIKSNHSLVF